MRNFTARALQSIGVVDHAWKPIEGNPVFLAMRAEAPLPEYEYDLVSSYVTRACDQWLESDLSSVDILIEHSWDNAAKGILDLVLLKDGQSKIVDWKTTGNVKRPGYAIKIREELQTALYLHYGGEYLVSQGWPAPDLMEYRCMDEKGQSTLISKPYDATIEGPTQLENVQELFATSTSQKWSSSWAMNKPQACFSSYNDSIPSCPFWEQCSTGQQPSNPAGLTEADWWALRPRSKSSISEFLRCPEHYRRTHVLGDMSTTSREALVGQATHAALACVWRLAWENRATLAV